MLQFIQVNAAKMNRHLVAISRGQVLNLEIKACLEKFVDTLEWGASLSCWKAFVILNLLVVSLWGSVLHTGNRQSNKQANIVCSYVIPAHGRRGLVPGHKKYRIHYLTNPCGIYLFSIHHQKHTVGNHAYRKTCNAFPTMACRISPACCYTHEWSRQFIC